MKKQEENKIKKEYLILLETGDLLEMFPHLTGHWEEDKEEVMTYFKTKTFNNEL